MIGLYLKYNIIQGTVNFVLTDTLKAFLVIII